MVAVKPQLFFLEGSLSEMRAVSKKRPIIRELCKKTSPLRTLQILPLFVIIAGYPELKSQADKVWQKALVRNRPEDTVEYAAQLISGDRYTLQKDNPLREVGLGFGICPDLGKLSAMIMLDRLRVLRWCHDTAVPTFTVQRAPEKFVATHERL